MLYKEIDPDPGLYLPRSLVKHASKLGVVFSKPFAQLLDSAQETPRDDVSVELDDLAYSEVQRLRAMMKSWEDTHYQGPLRTRVKFMWELHQDAFKKDFWDFTYLLEEGIRRGTAWKADYCAVDEINDLNALQATLAARIQGDQVEYVGDLDQAIYGFAGVNPKSILNILPYDKLETMELSHRLTAPIARAAEACLSQASWRSGGTIKTERLGGTYHDKQVIENVLLTIRNNPEAYGDTYVIGRTNWLVGRARHMAIEYGMNVAQNGEEDLLTEFCALLRDFPPMMRHSSIPCLVAPFLPAADYYQRGAKAGLLRLYEHEPDGAMKWSEFFSRYGTDRLKRTLAGEWREWYRGRIIDPLKPVIRFDTFHASKGMEADTVVLLRDITQRVEDEGERDEEIRLAYVAITRGRDHVFPVEMDYGFQSRWIPTSEPDSLGKT